MPCPRRKYDVRERVPAHIYDHTNWKLLVACFDSYLFFFAILRLIVVMFWKCLLFFCIFWTETPVISWTWFVIFVIRMFDICFFAFCFLAVKWMVHAKYIAVTEAKYIFTFLFFTKMCLYCRLELDETSYARKKSVFKNAKNTRHIAKSSN